MDFVETSPSLGGFLVMEIGSKALQLGYNYVEISTDFTKIIDTILMNHSSCYVSSKMFLGQNKMTPYVGTHRYYLNPPEQRSYIYPFKFINLIKKKVSTESSISLDANKYMYVACYSIINKDVFDKFIKQLSSNELSSIH